jgi:hypothetical protein
MMTKITPMLAMHWHNGGRGFFLLLLALACILVIVAWPGKSETK